MQHSENVPNDRGGGPPTHHHLSIHPLSASNVSALLFCRRVGLLRSLVRIGRVGVSSVRFGFGRGTCSGSVRIFGALDAVVSAVLFQYDIEFCVVKSEYFV